MNKWIFTRLITFLDFLTMESVDFVTFLFGSILNIISDMRLLVENFSLMLNISNRILEIDEDSTILVNHAFKIS